MLKNGRRIVAENVTDDGEHVAYQTPAGQMSLPKSIVARVERDNFTYSSGSSGSRPAIDPPVSAPQVEPVVVTKMSPAARFTTTSSTSPISRNSNPTRAPVPQFRLKKSPPHITPPRNS